MNIINNAGMVVDTASSLPEAARIIDSFDRHYIETAPHTIQREQETVVAPVRRKGFLARLFAA